jgi:hypothetical protein
VLALIAARGPSPANKTEEALGVDSMGVDGNLVQGEELREAPHQMVAGGGGSSSTPGAHFEGQKVSRRAKRRFSAVGRRSSVEQTAPAGEGKAAVRFCPGEGQGRCRDPEARVGAA